MKIFVDGSGWNGKESKYCVAFENGKVIKEIIKEKKTSNVMEYMVLIKALNDCNKKDEIFTDSQLVVNQISGKYKIKKEHLFPLVMKARKLLKEKSCSLAWISRKENLAGNLLEK